MMIHRPQESMPYRRPDAHLICHSESHTCVMESAGWSPSGSCSLFVCDIVSFGAEDRTDGIREHVRKAMYTALQLGFDGAGVPYDGLYREDRGDGALIAVRPEFDTSLLI